MQVASAYGGMFKAIVGLQGQGQPLGRGNPFQPEKIRPALAACCKGGVGRVASATGPNARRSAASALDIKHAGHLTSAVTKQAAL